MIEKEKVLSASDVESFVKCPRKWAFEKFEGVKKNASSARLGTRVHSILEDYQTIGTLPNVREQLILPDDRTGEHVTHWPGQIADAGIHLLPAPGVVEVEGAFTMRTPGAAWRGRKDGVYMLTPEGEPATVNGFKVKKDGFVLVVQDHKTTKDPRYAKVTTAPEAARFGSPAEVLSSDVQCLLYLYDEIKKHDLKKAAHDWVYYQTKQGKPKAWREFGTLDAGYVIEEVEKKIDTIAVEMLRLYKIRPKPQTLPPATSIDYCNAYGGCPNKSQCTLTTEEQIDMSTSTLSPMDAALACLKSQQAGLAAGTIPPVVPPPAAPPPPPPPSVPDAPPGYHEAIRAALAQGHTPEALATHYSVSLESVRALAAPPALPPIESVCKPGEAAPSPSPDPRPPAPLKTHYAIKEAYAKGFTVVQIAHHFGVSLVSVSELCPHVPALPPLPLPPPALPKVWAPGDPMNAAQDYLASQGKPAEVIAMAADVSPRAGYAPIVAPVERGLINPPEAPEAAPRNPEEMPPPVESHAEAAATDDLDALNRATLKALAVAQGYVLASTKLGEKGLREIIRERRAAGGGPSLRVEYDAKVDAAQAAHLATLIKAPTETIEAPHDDDDVDAGRSVEDLQRWLKEGTRKNEGEPLLCFFAENASRTAPINSAINGLVNAILAHVPAGEKRSEALIGLLNVAARLAAR